MPPVYLRDANANSCQFSKPVKTITTANLQTTHESTLLDSSSYYTVIANTNFWWKWGVDGIIYSHTVAVGDSESGLWPANKEFTVWTGTNTYMEYIADSKAGYITFYKNYGSGD